jgi:HEAT repeat protein
MAGIIALVLAVTATTTAQRERYINVDGPSLAARMDAATRQGKAGRGHFWTAYQFDIRPGVCLDNSLKNTVINGDRTRCESRDVGLFLLREQGTGAVVRAEVYSLTRQRDYEGHPVYWAGKATSQESLQLLRGLLTSEQSLKVVEHSVMAVALHDDPMAAPILEELIRTSNDHKVRAKTVFWLGQTPGHHPMLEELARNEQEDLEVRKQAVFSIGISQDQSAMSTLERLYSTVNEREVKRQVIFGAFVNQDKEASADFLIKRAESDPDRELKKQALFWLGQKAGQRSMEVLGKTLENNDEDTDVQVQAVFAISRRPKEESIPNLIRLAKTHPKGAIRNQALFWLGQSGDERALEVFKEILGR